MKFSIHIRSFCLCKVKDGQTEEDRQSEEAIPGRWCFRTEDVGVMDPAVERNVILTDGNNVDGRQFDADNGDNEEAGGLGQQGQERT